MGLLLAAPAYAQQVPPPLRDWQGWVLHDVPQHGCPFLANRMPGQHSYRCAWPGRLVLAAGKGGASFSLDVQVDAPSWVALPGDDGSWPQQVSVDGRPAVVLSHEGVPALRLAPGDYQVRGTLPWSTRPARLRVPAAIGLVTLSIDGAAVARIERNGDQLTLGEAAAARRVADALSLRVYRRLTDGAPATLETWLQLDVAGSAREQRLGPALPAGFVATALGGELPARLDDDGRLRVQLRPGRWTVTLDARAVAPLAQVALPSPPAPWPGQEIWSYQDDPDLRGTRVDGEPVDAGQAGVPEDWRPLPAFALDATHGLSVAQSSRGDRGAQDDRVRVRRELWLDFDGDGLSVADHLGGQLYYRQRLDVAAPWQLQRAAQDDAPLLVSRGAQGRSGVELRTRQLDLDAGLRLPTHRGALPVAGWQLPLEGIDAVLHLPSGYRLLGAPGADASPDSWVAQWSLLDLFVVALIALLAGRLLGWPWALLAAALYALAQHEAGAPRWTLALALALTLLLRALPAGRLRAAARTGALAAFALAVLWTLPFAATELQYALHPQLEHLRSGPVLQARLAEPLAEQPAGASAPEQRKAMVAPAPPMDIVASNQPAPPPAPPAPPSSLESATVAVTQFSAATQVARQTDSHSVIQAGPGRPQWDQGNDYRLGWSGPVTMAQTTRLLIAPAWLVRLLRVAMVGLLAALLARLVPLLLPAIPGRWRDWRGGGAASAALLALALLPHPAQAQATPDAALLAQLQQRLTEAPKCAPACASLAQAQLQASGNTLTLVLEAHAGVPVALPLPQTDAALQLQGVGVDGHEDAPLTRSGDQLLVRLERGVHRIALDYRIGAVDTASLRFALRPQRIAFAGQGWSLDGIDEGRPLGDSIALQRVRTVSDGQALPPAQSFPPYVRVTRTLLLGVDWTVENVAERIAPEQGGFSITLPLLPGEHPLGEGARVHDRRIGVTFNADTDVVRWNSRLDHAPRLTLTAPSLADRAEVWNIQAAPMWHVAASGVPTSDSAEGLRFQPLPGERLQLEISRPAAVEGASLAFDAVQVTSQVGERATETSLTLHARSTRGGEHAITLPADAELLQAQRDGQPLELAVRKGKLGLPLLPDAHVYTLRLRQPQGAATRTRTPVLALDAPAANIALDLQLPQDRWVLWTWGPAAGPAVLYWSQLAVLLLAAWLLARHAPTPLRFRHWLLLGLGFSAFAWSAYALVVLWLILLGLRARHTPPQRWGATRFNLLQTGLAALTALALVVLVGAVPQSLLGLPDMHVAGNDSSAWQLRWFADRTADALPQGGVFSLPLWVYKAAMLAWALWLANALIGWLRWGFAAWTRDGYWRRHEPRPQTQPPQLPGAEPTAHD
jgi:hypothetical protein